MGGVDRLSGGDPGFRAAGRDGMGRRRLLEIAGTVWNWRRDRPSRCRRRGLDRLAAVVARGGSEFLGAQRLGGSAWIRLVPRGDPPSGRASAEAKERRRARAHAGDELRRRRNSPRFDRRPGRDRRLAGDAVDRIGVGSRRAAPTDLAHARQRRRHHVGLPRRSLARLGLRRRQHGPAARSRGVRRRAVGRARLAGGASLRHPYRRRALWLPHRERAGRTARQRTAEAGDDPPRGDRTPPGRSTSSS